MTKKYRNQKDIHLNLKAFANTELSQLNADWLKNYRIYLWIYSTKSIIPQMTMKNNLSCLRKKKQKMKLNKSRDRYSGKYFIIAQRPKFGEPLILLVVRTQISVELQSRYLNEASKNLWLLVQREAFNEG